MRMSLVLLQGVLLITLGCSTMTEEEKAEKRSSIDEMAATAVAALVEQDPELKTEMDKVLGYAVASMKVTKVPVVGAGAGEGVVVDGTTNNRTYFTVTRLDIGGGWGARSYKLLILLKTNKALERLLKGTLEYQVGVEASAGKTAAEGSSGGLNKDFSLHVLSDGGASATATARVIRIKVNSKLSSD
jgi:lipid-binding SYLF domain-containing protein